MNTFVIVDLNEEPPYSHKFSSEFCHFKIIVLFNLLFNLCGQSTQQLEKSICQFYGNLSRLMCEITATEQQDFTYSRLTVTMNLRFLVPLLLMVCRL